jgi:hypothetical protein
MKILSEGGVFREFDGVRVSARKDIIELYFSDGSWLKTTPEHKIMTSKGYIESKDLKESDKVISTNGEVVLIFKTKSNELVEVFDPVEVEETHNYFSNGILSHQCVYLDEFAFVQNDVEFFTSTYPVIASGKKTKIIITSTPNGMNLFYKIYTDAQHNRNEFYPVKFTWECHPDRDEAWKKETIRNTSLAQFKQEHACEFLGSSDTLISGECLEKMVYQNPITESDYHYLYKKPIIDHTYVVCVDVGEGIGRDFSTAVVIDITSKPYEQVFVFRRNDISPWLITGTILQIAQRYNLAHILVENNSVGKIVADEMFYEHDYENVVSSKVKGGEERYTGNNMEAFGVTMNRKTKMIGCSALKTLIEEGLLQIVDFNTIQELSCFIKVRNSYEAEKKRHDDLVMPLVNFAWLTTQTMFEDLSLKGIDVLLKEAKERETDNSLVFGYYDDGTEYADEVFRSRIWNS